MEEQVDELPPLKVKDIPVFKTLNTDNLDKYMNIMVEEMKKASGLILNTFRELEEPDLVKLGEQFHMPTFTIGPFHKCFSSASSSLLEQDRSSITWLDKQAPRSVLYVSFGSIATLDADKLEEVAWGLANSPWPFLWVIRPGLISNSLDWDQVLPNELLNSIKKQGYIVKWAPQQEVLSHPSVGGFWTHSGWNSTLESICEGVPMICSPFLGDQMVNSRYVSDVWKIGIKLEKGLERGEIENAIRNLMVGKEGEEMRRRIMSLKEKTDDCFNSGGSSCQSLDDLIDFLSSI